GALILDYYNWNVIFIVMGAFSILTILLSPKESNKQEKKTHQDNVKLFHLRDNTRFTNAKLTILLHINIT
ncbi:hypothetical protein MMS21_29500, partial [Escherichia coli]|nr:hypothetical protein [Escherichia coli]